MWWGEKVRVQQWHYLRPPDSETRQKRKKKKAYSFFKKIFLLLWPVELRSTGVTPSADPSCSTCKCVGGWQFVFDNHWILEFSGQLRKWQKLEVHFSNWENRCVLALFNSFSTRQPSHTEMRTQLSSCYSLPRYGPCPNLEGALHLLSEFPTALGPSHFRLIVVVSHWGQGWDQLWMVWD